MGDEFELVPVAVVSEQRWLDGKKTMEPMWISEELAMPAGSTLYAVKKKHQNVDIKERDQ